MNMYGKFHIKISTWFLHKDNVLAHSALSIKRLFSKCNIPVFDHPHYSLDLAPCYFYLFLKVTYVLKGTRFESVESAKKKAACIMNRKILIALFQTMEYSHERICWG